MLKIPILDWSLLRGKVADQETEYADYILSLGSMDLHRGCVWAAKKVWYYWVRQRLKKGLYWSAWASHPCTWLTVVAMQQIRKGCKREHGWSIHLGFGWWSTMQSPIFPAKHSKRNESNADRNIWNQRDGLVILGKGLVSLIASTLAVELMSHWGWP